MIDLNYSVPKNVNRARIDIGMSSTGPNTAFWLNKYNNMFVIGVEPNPYNYERLFDGENGINDYKIIINENIVKLNNKTLCNYVEKGNYLYPVKIAIDNVDDICKKTFYCTSMLNTGCSSLHKPIDERLNGVKTENEVEVDVVSLEKLLENFPFEQIPVIEFLKTDTQSNDLNVVKSCGKYLSKLCFVFSEYYAHSAYEGEKNQRECFEEFDEFMIKNGFKRFFSSWTDVGYVNIKLIPYIIENGIVNDCIEFQNGHNWI